MPNLKLATWNINGLLSKIEEVKLFIEDHNIDILLISESHLTPNSGPQIPGYTVYFTPHPDGTAHAGSALILKNAVKHYCLPEIKIPELQATSVVVNDLNGPMAVSAAYCPPRHKIKEPLFSNYFKKLGHRFITGGDWNAKNTLWGSRLTTTRGRELKNAMDLSGYCYYSTGEPTNWPPDRNKIPDLLDFYITSGISNVYCHVESSLYGSSDHTPVILTISTNIILKKRPLRLTNKKTDWVTFQDYVDSTIKLRIPLKSPEDIDDATAHFTSIIQCASWKSTPDTDNYDKRAIPTISTVKNMVREKRRLRRVWHMSRRQSDKTALNKAAVNLRRFLRALEDETLQAKLTSLSTSGKGEHSLWKMVKGYNKPQPVSTPIKTGNDSWARSEEEKANAFGIHLGQVFTATESVNKDWEKDVEDFLKSDMQLSLPITPFRPKEVAAHIRDLDSHKAPGYDLITPIVLKKLPRKGIVFLTMLFNSVLRVGYFPLQWKMSQIVMVPKPGKKPTQITSYRPISLLPVISKLFERMLVDRMRPVIESRNLIPNHQFGFRRNHSTIEQVHRVANEIRQAMEEKQYCSAVFLDVQQAFDKVWHAGLLFKLKENLPHTFYIILKSYLENRMFFVQYGDALSQIHDIHAGVPQGSVMGPILYTLYTSDLPVTDGVLTATYADDTAVLTRDVNPHVASHTLQAQLDKLDLWLSKWKIKISAPKSQHITFTLRKDNCPEVKMNNQTLPHVNTVKYLGVHLDRRLTWRDHISAKRDILNNKYRSMVWIMGTKSRLSVENKLLLYKSVLKPVWTYALELWGSASSSNVEILQRFQNSVLKTIAQSPWFVRAQEVHDYLEVPTIKEEILRQKHNYRQRLACHTNMLAKSLVENKSRGQLSRLKKARILDP